MESVEDEEATLFDASLLQKQQWMKLVDMLRQIPVMTTQKHQPKSFGIIKRTLVSIINYYSRL